MKILTNTLAFAPKTETLPPAYHPLSRFELVIMVGLTGVGKSTVVGFLQQKMEFQLLPNRRILTDEIIIAPLQTADGNAPHPVADRVQRFEYTARYRAKNPGGMAFALSQLVINTGAALPLFVFDGLRGLNEVKHAVDYFPKARFVVLDAPDTVRLSRLLKRGDTFDAAGGSTTSPSHTIRDALHAVPDVGVVFSGPEINRLAENIETGELDLDEVIQKIAIIVQERRNYDSQGARQFLTQTLPPDRVLVIDTTAYSTEEVTRQVQAWLD